jgi:predicted aldo/keto reductase-like oxidoreductase
MQYRKVGNTGIDVSILGFGAMRLPQRSLNPEDIDEKLAVSMIRGAIDRGVTYVEIGRAHV